MPFEHSGGISVAFALYGSVTGHKASLPYIYEGSMLCCWVEEAAGGCLMSGGPCRALDGVVANGQVLCLGRQGLAPGSQALSCSKPL